MNNWIDKHSIDCSLCGKLFDERDAVRLYPEGQCCQECFEDNEFIENEDGTYEIVI